MASRVYSVNFASVAGLTADTGPIDIFVPEGVVYILRDLDAFAATGTTFAGLYVRDYIVGNTVIYHRFEAFTRQAFQWTGRQVFEHLSDDQPGIRIENDGPQPFDVRLSGYVLLAPPSP